MFLAFNLFSGVILNVFAIVLLLKMALQLSSKTPLRALHVRGLF